MSSEKKEEFDCSMAIWIVVVRFCNIFLLFPPKEEVKELCRLLELNYTDCSVTEILSNILSENSEDKIEYFTSLIIKNTDSLLRECNLFDFEANISTLYSAELISGKTKDILNKIKNITCQELRKEHENILIKLKEENNITFLLEDDAERIIPLLNTGYYELITNIYNIYQLCLVFDN